MSEETRRDMVLIVIFSLSSAIGITSVFLGYRFLAWLVIVMGFTDYSPKPGYGQLGVIAQLVSGVLLLAALFPIHISRISTFKNP